MQPPTTYDERAAVLGARGFVPGAPPSVSPEEAVIDAALCAASRCPRCGACGLGYDPYHHPRDGRYRTLASCPACGHTLDFGEGAQVEPINPADVPRDAKAVRPRKTPPEDTPEPVPVTMPEGAPVAAVVPATPPAAAEEVQEEAPEKEVPEEESPAPLQPLAVPPVPVCRCPRWRPHRIDPLAQMAPPQSVPPPDESTDAPAGSLDKIQVLTERASKRQVLWHPRDNRAMAHIESSQSARRVESDILRVLREVGRPLTRRRLMKEISTRGMEWDEGLVGHYLARMVRDGMLNNLRGAMLPGYRLPEWNEKAVGNGADAAWPPT